MGQIDSETRDGNETKPDLARIIEEANKTSVLLPSGYFRLPGFINRLLRIP